MSENNYSWSGQLTFGLNAIPFYLSPAARTERVSFKSLHSKCLERLRQPFFCERCNQVVERKDVVKALEHEKGQYLIMSPQQIADAQPESARTIEIERFVALDDIDPVYFDAAYNASTDEEHRGSYASLIHVLFDRGVVGIGKITMHNRESLAAIRARRTGLMVHTLFWESEIRNLVYPELFALLLTPIPATLIDLVRNLTGSFYGINKSGDSFSRHISQSINGTQANKELTINKGLFNALDPKRREP